MATGRDQPDDRLCSEDRVASAPAASTWKRWLFIVVFAVYLVTGSGQFQTIDAAQELSVAISMRHGNGFRSDFETGVGGGTVHGRDGNTFAGHDIGASLLYLPFTLIPGTVAGHGADVGEAQEDPPDRIAASRTQERERLLPSRRLYFAASFLGPLLGALIVVTFARILDELRFDSTTVAVSALALAFTTTIWVYSHISFDSTATALAVTAAVWAVIRFTRSNHWLHALVAGCCLGLGVLVRVDTIIMVPFLAAPIVLLAIRSRGSGITKRLRIVAVLLGPIAVAATVDLAYNWYRFGSITDNGHAADGFLQFNPRILDGVFGQIASPGKGVLIFSPLLFVALFRWRWFLRRHALVAGSLAMAAAATLLAHAAIVGWAGDQAWGARFTVPLVPLLMIPIARIIQEIRRGRLGRTVRIGVICVGLGGFLVQVSGVFSDFFAVVVSRRLRGEDTTTSLLHPAYLDGLTVLVRSISSSQPYADLTQEWIDTLQVARFDLWWVRAAQQDGWNPVNGGIPLFLITIALWGAWRIFRELSPAKAH